MSKINLRVTRQLLKTKGRMLAIALIVGCGVAVYVGMGTSVATVLYTRDAIIERDHLSEYQVHFWAIANDEVPDLTAIPGVTNFEPRMIFKGTVALPNNEKLQGAIHFLPLAGQGPMNKIELVDGRYFKGPEDMQSAIIDKALATYHGYKVGDEIKITIGQADHVWKIIGICISPDHLVATANPEFMIPQKGSLGVIYLPKEKQDDLLGVHLVNNLALGLDPRVDRADFDETIRPYFKAIEVERWEPKEESFSFAFLKKDMNALALFVPAIVAVFLLVTVLVTYVIFRQIISDQRQEIGTMMALGYSKWRIIRSFLVSALLIGVVAGVVGLVMSLLITDAFNNDYSKGLGLAIVLHHWEPMLMLKGFALALGTTLASVAVPTLQITRLQPISAVRPVMDVVVRRKPGLLASLFGRTAMGRYSIRNITRNRFRFATTVLSIGASVAVALAYRTSVVSIDRTFEDYFRTDNWDIVAEYVEPQVVPGDRLGSLKGVKAVEEYAKGNVKVIGPSGSKVLQAVGLEYPSKLKSHDVVQGRLPSGQRGEVIVYRKLADEIGAKLGDTVQVKGIEDTLPLKVVGITTFSPEQVYMQLGDAQQLLKQEHKVTGALVQVSGDIDQVAADIRGQKSVGNLYEKAQIVSALKVHSKELLAVISIAIFLAILVACLVIASTVIINVLEREPDYATLRVQGFEVKKVQRGILGEVIVTGAIGALLSVPLSFLISEFLNNQMGQAFFYVKTVVEPQSVVIVVLLALAFMPIAAWPGMRRVRRINLAEAVRRKAMG